MFYSTQNRLHPNIGLIEVNLKCSLDLNIEAENWIKEEKSCKMYIKVSDCAN